LTPRKTVLLHATRTSGPKNLRFAGSVRLELTPIGIGE
jgi:hypothetical protein